MEDGPSATKNSLNWSMKASVWLVRIREALAGLELQ